MKYSINFGPVIRILGKLDWSTNTLVHRTFIHCTLFIAFGCSAIDGTKPYQNLRSDSTLNAGQDSGNSSDKSSDSDAPGTVQTKSAEDENEVQAGQGNQQVPAENLAGQFFLQTVYPLFEQQCTGCHSLPQNPTEVKAPLSIYSYQKMKPLLEAGSSGESNELINKMRNLTAHGGRDRCGPDGVKASPCLEVTQWWSKEFGKGGNIPGSTLKGMLEGVTSNGDISGYAVDSSDLTGTISVAIYIDHLAGSGIADVNLIANQIGVAGGYSGNHRFSTTLANNFRDGKTHTAYAYAVANGQTTLLPGGPLQYLAFSPSAAGQSFFNTSLKPIFDTKCQRCHNTNYSAQYAALILPAPGKGGTALDNNMINFPAGLNQHPGGNLCGSKAGSPCNLIQQWWTLEFGTK